MCKKPNKNDEVSYYIEEPQPVPEAEPHSQPQEEALVDDAIAAAKPSLFKFRGRSPKHVQEELDEAETIPEPKEEEFKPRPSFFKFKGRSPKQVVEVFEDSQDIIEPTQEPNNVKVTDEQHKRPSFFKSRSRSPKQFIDPEDVSEPITDTEQYKRPGFFKSRSRSPKQVVEAIEQDSENVPEQIQEPNSVHVTDNEYKRPGFFKFKGRNTQQGLVKEHTEVVEDVIQPEMDELGPIREEKPSFLIVAKADVSTDEQTEVAEEIDADQAPRMPKRGKKFSGLSGLFKSQPKDKKSKQIGAMAPVDISHLIEDEEAEAQQEQQQQEQQLQQEQQQEQQQQQQQESSNEPVPRSRAQERKKSSGLGNFFGPAKPRSRPSSQTRGDQFARDNRRARSLPRQRSKGGGGLGDFFSLKPPAMPQKPPDNETPMEPELIQEQQPPPEING